MDYHFENLGDERFQQLCQALLVKEHRGVQCFPVGMPDGGRDAMLVLETLQRDTKEFIAFQVKYVRNPSLIDRPHAWLEQVIREESSKLPKLVTRGAVRYVVMTNVQGTSHLDSGSIDKVQDVLAKNVPIPSVCLWRDDLSRRLDDAWDLKWSFPEILSGSDILRYILHSALGEPARARLDAFHVALSAQYDYDKDVRFKQVDFQNRLTDIFVESPLSVSRIKDGRRLAFVANHRLGAAPFALGHDSEPGAATALLSEHFSVAFPLCVIEGAPGQGKSTLAQYICQVYRMRLLGLRNDIEQLPPRHVPKALRLPFKIDLKELATWLNGRDPFSPEAPPGERPIQWVKSLESFLAAQVRHFCGGAPFDVADLQAICKYSSILLVFDGLDEVAGVADRREIVREVSAALTRLKALAQSVQAVVTTRPAAFANSPGFSADRFSQFGLASLTTEQIGEFAQKWIKVRKLQGREAGDVNRVLRQKLEQPHLRELAKNPMQLTILLSLIHSRGASLPDKRTHLYDTYVDVFFARESEKDHVVREHRELLIDIHRYLAWCLHSQAEKGQTGGTMDGEALKMLLREYLRNEGRNPEFIDELFSTMAQRVMFIVSRVEGRYEFEVQPIREYFAARHLHETAPYSPPGAERKGTRPERFSALATNFYWLNVTRFYCGCFSKGELPSLIEGLQELASRKDFAQSGYPQMLTALLLGDWVFTQNQRSTQSAIELAMARTGTWRLTPTRRRIRRRSESEIIGLSDACGRSEVVRRCAERLWRTVDGDLAWEYIQVLSANSSEAERRDVVRQVPLSYDRAMWLRNAGMLGTLSRMDHAELLRRKGAQVWNGREVALMVRYGLKDFVESDLEACRAFIDEALDVGIRSHLHADKRSCLERLSAMVDPWRYQLALHGAPNESSFRDALRRYGYERVETRDNSDRPWPEQLEPVAAFVNMAEELWDRPTEEWLGSSAHWNAIVDGARGLFGDRWALFQIASVAAYVRGGPDGKVSDAVLEDLPLSEQARVLAGHRRAPNAWKRYLITTVDPHIRMMRVLVLIACCPVSVIVRCSSEFSASLESLSTEQWTKMFDANRSSRRLSEIRQDELSDNALASIHALSARAAALLVARLGPKGRQALLDQIFESYDGEDIPVLRTRERLMIERAIGEPVTWKDAQHAIGALHERDPNGEVDGLVSDLSERNAEMIPADVARDVVDTSDGYPRWLVVQCQERCRLEAAAGTTPVADVAAIEGWFASK